MESNEFYSLIDCSVTQNGNILTENGLMPFTMNVLFNGKVKKRN